MAKVVLNEEEMDCPPGGCAVCEHFDICEFGKEAFASDIICDDD